MKKAGRKAVSFCKTVAALAVGVFLFTAVNMPAFAYDDSYVGDGAYWNDKGEVVNISNGTFDGIMKYATDKDSGCVYFYFTFYDSSLSDNSDKVYIILKISNSKNSYVFSVGDGEIIADGDSNIEDNFNIYSDFSKLNPKYHGGEIFIAAEFKNSDDKKLENNIACEYSCGKNTNFDIDQNITLDMVPTTTAKATTTKSTTTKTTKQTTAKTTKATTVKTTAQKTTKTTKEKTTKQTTTKLTTVKTTRQSTTKSSSTKKSTSKSTKKSTKKSTAKSTSKKNKTTKTTKFKASSVTTSKSTTTAATKFKAAAVQSESETSSSKTTTSNTAPESYAPSDMTSYTAVTADAFESETESRLSTYSRIALALAIVLFVTGMFLTIYACTKGKYKIVKVDDENNTADNDDKNES